MKAKLHKDIKSSRDFGDRLFKLDSKDFYKDEWELLVEIYDSLGLIETGQRLFKKTSETAHRVANLPIDSSFSPEDTRLRDQEIQSILIAGASRLELLLKLASREVEGLITFEGEL